MWLYNVFNSHWRSMWGYYMIFFRIGDTTHLPHPHVTTEKNSKHIRLFVTLQCINIHPGIYGIGVGRLVKALKISENKFLFMVKLLIYPMGNHYKSVFIT